MTMRGVAFWSIDTLSGSKVRKEVKTVRQLNARDSLAALQRRKLLKNQLSYVTAHVPYYRKYQGVDSLEEFPVLDKEMIRNKRTEMISDGVDPEKCHETSTSGSTGTPFRVLHSFEKRRRVNAEAIYFGQLAGYQLGNTLWHLKIWTARNKYSKFGAFIKNLKVKDVSTFEEKDVAEFLAEIQQTRGLKSIISYSSSLETIARALNSPEGGQLPRPRLSSIIGQSEPLSSEAREILFENLGTYPVARYGMEELGILAQQESFANAKYRLNLASHVVEVLKLESSERASSGEVGRIVVTELMNRAQPLIRYDTGDLGVVAEFEPETGFVESLASLEGRSRERIYDVDDRPLAPMIAYNFWWKFPEILQYQIVQSAKGTYELRIDAIQGFTKEAEIVYEFRKHVGNTATIDVVHTTDGFRHASGKRKVIVAQYDPPKS